MVLRKDIPDNGLSLSDTMSVSSVMRKPVDLELVLGDSRKKSQAESLAWDGLLSKLKDRESVCKRCGGSGEKHDGSPCGPCGTTGVIKVEADMRAIEMVLSPKFPKTSINVNADIDNMGIEDVINYIKES